MSGAKVWAHTQHGAAEKAQNVAVGILLADWGENVWLLPTSTEPGAKNADAEINGRTWEFKTNKAGTGTSIDTEIKRASKQAENVLLHLTVPMPLSTLENAIFGRVRQCHDLTLLRIIHENRLIEFSRADIMSQVFRGEIKRRRGPDQSQHPLS